MAWVAWGSGQPGGTWGSWVSRRAGCSQLLVGLEGESEVSEWQHPIPYSHPLFPSAAPIPWAAHSHAPHPFPCLLGINTTVSSPTLASTCPSAHLVLRSLGKGGGCRLAPGSPSPWGSRGSRRTWGTPGPLVTRLPWAAGLPSLPREPWLASLPRGSSVAFLSLFGKDRAWLRLLVPSSTSAHRGDLLPPARGHPRCPPPRPRGESPNTSRKHCARQKSLRIPLGVSLWIPVPLCVPMDPCAPVPLPGEDHCTLGPGGPGGPGRTGQTQPEPLCIWRGRER